MDVPSSDSAAVLKRKIMKEAWIIDAKRIPRSVGKVGKGKLAHLHPHKLLATALKGLSDNNSFNTKDIDDVIAGCGSQRLSLIHI